MVESSPAKKDWGVLVDENLDMSWSLCCAHSPGKPQHPLLHPQQRGQEGEGGDLAPLLHPGETSTAVLHPAMGSPTYTGHGPVRVNPGEGHEED